MVLLWVTPGWSKPHIETFNKLKEQQHYHQLQVISMATSSSEHALLALFSSDLLFRDVTSYY
jgi:hypothetical protein